MFDLWKGLMTTTNFQDKLSRLRGGFAALLVVGALVSGCASAPQDPEARAAWEEANDPWEDYNRYMFEVNYGLDQLVLRPFAGWYRIGVPEPLRDMIHNGLNNIRSPLVFVNDLLQGEGERAGVTLGRFVLNSTVGLGGLFDVADMWLGWKYHSEDFGQTLAVWGVGSGPYLVLPLFGPSNPRDAVGMAVDGYIDPMKYVFEAIGDDVGPRAKTVLNALDQRSRAFDALDEIQKTSIDYYATMRSLSRQRRADEIRNGEDTKEQLTPTYSKGEGSDDMDMYKDISKMPSKKQQSMASPALDLPPAN